MISLLLSLAYIYLKDRKTWKVTLYIITDYSIIREDLLRLIDKNLLRSFVGFANSRSIQTGNALYRITIFHTETAMYRNKSIVVRGAMDRMKIFSGKGRDRNSTDSFWSKMRNISSKSIQARCTIRIFTMNSDRSCE